MQAGELAEEIEIDDGVWIHGEVYNLGEMKFHSEIGDAY